MEATVIQETPQQEAPLVAASKTEQQQGMHQHTYLQNMMKDMDKRSPTDLALSAHTIVAHLSPTAVSEVAANVLAKGEKGTWIHGISAALLRRLPVEMARQKLIAHIKNEQYAKTLNELHIQKGARIATLALQTEKKVPELQKKQSLKHAFLKLATARLIGNLVLSSVDDVATFASYLFPQHGEKKPSPTHVIKPSIEQPPVFSTHKKVHAAGADPEPVTT